VVYLANGVYGYAYCASRGSYPLVGIYFFIQILIGVGIILLGGSTGFNAILLLPLAGHSVVLLPEMTRYAVNGVIVALYALCMRWMNGSWEIIWTNLPIFIAGQVFILVFTQMAVGEEQARHEVQNLVKELEEANRSLRIYATKAEDLAIIQERNRLAREIHDGLGHHLTALNMQIRGARAVLSSNFRKADELLLNAEGLTQKALVDVRQSVSSLRAEVEYKSLAEQIEAVLQVCVTSGVEVDFKVLGAIRPTGPEIHMALSRAAQECVNNMLKHSGASQVSVELDYQSPVSVRFNFLDNGKGSDVPMGGYGLIGMKERVSLLEGELLINTTKGRGFSVEICLPG
jgi:signal transduction histidine kinase